METSDVEKLLKYEPEDFDFTEDDEASLVNIKEEIDDNSFDKSASSKLTEASKPSVISLHSHFDYVDCDVKMEDEESMDESLSVNANMVNDLIKKEKLHNKEDNVSDKGNSPKRPRVDFVNVPVKAVKREAVAKYLKIDDSTLDDLIKKEELHIKEEVFTTKENRMERITAYSAGRPIFADAEKFVYYRRAKKKNTFYLSCKEKNCTGKAAWEIESNVFRITMPHNHEASDKHYQELLFRQSVRHRAATERTPVRDIFMQEQRNNPVGGHCAEYDRLSKMLYSYRTLVTPDLPESIVQFGEIIGERRFLSCYGKDLSLAEQPFYRGILKADDGTPLAVFMSESIKRFALRKPADFSYNIDATFKLVPRYGLGTQLLIVHVNAFHTVFPLLYAFMERKTEAVCARALKYLSKVVPVVPTFIMFDCDELLQKAIEAIWPAVPLRGCWFHCARIVFKKSREFGIQDSQRELTKIAMTLPLLPQELIDQGFQYLGTLGININFLDCLRRHWLGLNFSVHQTDQRINNSVEFFHRQMFTRFGRPHNSIWALLETLRVIQHGKENDLVQLESGRPLPQRRKAQFVRANVRITRAQESLQNDLKVPQFLCTLSEEAERLVRLFGPAEAIALYGEGDVFDLDQVTELVNEVLEDMNQEEQEEETAAEQKRIEISSEPNHNEPVAELHVVVPPTVADATTSAEHSDEQMPLSRPMERITAHAAGRAVFADAEKFLYLSRSRVNNIFYLCCREECCRGRAIWQTGIDKFRLTSPHNHEPSDRDYQELLFRQSLRQRAASEKTNFKDIFLEEQQNYPIGGQDAEYGNFSKILYRARKAGTPKVPQSIVEFGKIIEESSCFNRYGVDLSLEEHPFYREILKAHDGSTMAIFISESVKRFTLRRPAAVSYNMDSSLKLLPREGLGAQLLVVHVNAFDTIFPLFYAFMERKTEESYICALKHLAEVVPVAPTTIIFDYEEPLRKAIEDVWPNSVSLKGCWFHYARMVFKKSGQLGLQGDEKQKELTKISMLIPLLPQELIEQGFQYLEAEGVNTDLLDYLRKQFLGQDISVHRTDQRINNAVEAFHRQLFIRFSRPHNSIWSLLETLRVIEHGKETDLARLEAGVELPQRRKAKYIRANNKISRAEESFQKDRDVPQFLHTVSHVAQRLVRLFGPAEAIAFYGDGDVPDINQMMVLVKKALEDMDKEEQDEEPSDEQKESVAEPKKAVAPVVLGAPVHAEHNKEQPEPEMTQVGCPISMERITGFAAGRSVFADDQKFLYYRRSLQKSIFYLSCCQENCRGRAVWETKSNRFRVTGLHNHEACDRDYQELLFRRALRQRAATENTPFRDIFLQEQRNNPVGSHKADYDKMSNLMFRARKAGTPKIPQNIKEFGEIIADQSCLNRYGMDLSLEEHIFYRDVLIADDGSTTAVFISESIKRFVIRSPADVSYIMDASFKLVPRHGFGIDLLIVHVNAFHTVFPLLYAFIEKKTETVYTKCLSYLAEVVPVVPTTIMYDYEELLRKAIEAVWPCVRLKGCWFHYARNVFKKSRQQGLQDNDRQQELTKLAMVIPLLPQDLIQEGFQFLENEKVNTEFMDYLRKQWLNRDISAHRTDQRTNNSLELFHRKFFARVGRPHNNIWALLETLKLIEHEKVCDLVRLETGVELPRRRKPRDFRVNARITRAEESLQKSRNVPLFLRIVGLVADRLVQLFEPAEAIALYGEGNAPDMDQLLLLVNKALEDMAQKEQEEEPVAEQEEEEETVSVPAEPDNLEMSIT